MNDLPPSIRNILRSEILDIAADAVIVIDENHTILFFSRSAERTFGYTADEIRGHPLAKLLPVDSGEEQGRLIQRLASEDIPLGPMADRFPAIGRRQDGSEFPAEVNIAKVMDEGQRVLVVVLRDRQPAHACRGSAARQRGTLSLHCHGNVGRHRDAGCDRAHRHVQRQRRAHSGAHARPDDGPDFTRSAVAGHLRGWFSGSR